MNASVLPLPDVSVRSQPPPAPEGGRDALALEADNRSLRRRVRLLERELHHQAHQLQERNQFLAQMSHELRTPLNGVVGMAQLLIGTPLNEEQQEIVQMLTGSAENLIGLVNDTLDFSKIEAGALILEATRFDLGLIVESVFDMVSRAAAEKGLALVYLPAPDAPDNYIGDPMRMRQILLNLVSNAVKFTPAGEVVVRARTEWLLADRAACRLHLTVTDTGIGIPEDRLEAIFQPYAQAEASTARRFGGTGLGLPIVRRLAALMQGTVTATSRPQQGSTFTFSAQLAAAPPMHAPTPRFDGKRLLLAESHLPTRDMIAGLLGRTGATLLSASTTAEALTLLDSGSVDAALYSAQLRDADGTRVLLSARQHSVGAHLPALEYHPLGQRPSGTTVQTLTTPMHRDALYEAVGELLNPGSASPAHAPATRTNGSSLRILLAEDNPINQMVALRLLESLGFRADVVENGLEAVEAVQRRPYDVVLMDVMMPVMDGLEATRRIRQANLPRSPRIIAVTANALASDRHRCLEAGMDEHIPKPLRVEVLASALKQTLPAAEAPASLDEASSGVVDYNTLRALRASVGEDDLSFFDELVADFLVDTRQLLDDLDASIEVADAITARRAAHTLKSSAAMFGAHPLSDSARKVEQAIKQDNLATLRPMADSMRSQFGDVECALEDLRVHGYRAL